MYVLESFEYLSELTRVGVILGWQSLNSTLRPDSLTLT
jgi:hypothetical protein